MKLKLNRYQENLWEFADLYPNVFYNLGLSFRLSKELNPYLLEKAFSYVVEHTDILHAVLLGDKRSGFYFETENKGRFHLVRDIASLEDCLEDMENFTHLPFDLANQWPIRAKLYHLPDDSFMLVIVFHHIGIDGVSVVDLLSMLAEVYDQLEQDDCYPELRIPAWSDYLDHVSKVDEVSWRAAITYWKQCFSGKVFRTDFPDVTSAGTDYSCQYHEFELGEELMARINHIARQNGTTSFLVILAAWMFVLSRFSGQKEIFVDNPINRRPAKSRNLIGFFVNSLPYYADAFGDSSRVCDLLLNLTKQHKALRSFRDYTLSEILTSMGGEQVALTLGKVNVGINFVGWSDSLVIPFKGVSCHFFRRLDHFLASDLLLEVEPTQVGLSRIGFKSHFTQEYVQALAQALRVALFTFTDNPDQHLSGISLVSAEETKALSHAFEKQLDQLLPIDESINEVFERVTRTCPDKEALIYGEHSMTYKEVLEYSNLGAHQLRSAYLRQFGQELPVGEPIGIYTTNKLQAILWIFTILRAGGAYVSLDVSYPKERISFMAQDYGMRCVLSDEKDVAEKIPSALSCFSLKKEIECEADNNHVSLPRVNKSSLAYIISTSGTTGKPKGVPIRHEQVLTLIQSGLLVPDDDQRVLQFASLCFDASVGEIFWTLLNGSTLVIATEEQRLDVDLLNKLLIGKRISVAMIPPVLLARFPKIELPDLTHLWVAGESTPEHVINYWKKGRLFYNGCGPTETTVFSNVCQMDDSTPANDIGLPLIGVTCYVLDHDLNLVPDYVRGELYIGGPQVTSGYINRPDLNREKFIDNPFATARDRELGRNLVLYKSGDLVSRLPNGHFLYHGRIDFQVKIHSFRVELGEIESSLNQCPGVEGSLVLAKDVAGDKKLVAYVIVDENTSEEISGSQLRNFLSKHLPYYMIPSKWVFVSHFPLTVNGKIDKNALPEPDFSSEDAEIDIVPPKSLEEHLLERVIAEVCKMDKVSVDADLFDMGISSIEVMMVIAQAANLGLELSVSRFYQEKTIRAIVRDNKAQFCFWADETVRKEDKPILLLVCGDAYFNPDYLHFVERFGKDYAILVLDSYHAYFTSRENLSWEELMNVYRRMVGNVLGDRVPKLIAGFCIGGEMALSVASLFAECDSKPTLVLLDSFANRRKWGIWSFDYTESLGMLRERLVEETSGLLQSQVLYAYPGDIRLFLANQFTIEHIQDADKKSVEERVYGQFRENASAWQELVPQCRIEWIECDHWHMLDRLAVDQIYEKLAY